MEAYCCTYFEFSHVFGKFRSPNECKAKKWLTVQALTYEKIGRVYMVAVASPTTVLTMNPLKCLGDSVKQMSEHISLFLLLRV